jgi:nucleoside-diphosphate-sugar epimerase
MSVDILPEYRSGCSTMKVALTGHTGFIGRRLVKRLVTDGVTVLPLMGNIQDARTWHAEFDILYHLAGSRPSTFAQSAAEAFRVDVGGILNALVACRKNRARLVLTSSCAVYARSKLGPLSEKHPLQPTGPYGMSKLICETICRDFSKIHPVSCTVLRLFNAYGPSQSVEFLIPYLIRCAQNGLVASIAHPDSCRDFVHVDDVVDALVSAAHLDTDWSVFNVGSGQARSVREVVEILGTMRGAPLSYREVACGPDPVDWVQADNALARRELQWRPRIDFEFGLRDLLSKS